ncbi:MAG: glycosyltransferase family 39 protein [Planctomycetota bacterium]
MLHNVPKRSRAAEALAALAVLALCLWRVPLLLARNYDPDELQHLHGAYSVLHGLVPYVDYFEHHPPWTAWLLAPLVRALGPEWSAVQASRALMCVFAWGAVWATYLLGRRTVGRSVAGTGTLLLCGVTLFVDRSLEIRPDVPATCAWLFGLVALLRGVAGGTRAAFATAGLLFGCGFMFTPKLAFGVTGAALGALLTAPPGARAARVRGVALMTAAAFVPLGVTLAVLAAQGAAGAFVQHVIVMPLSWPRELSPMRFTRELFERNPAVTVLGALGVAASLAALVRRPGLHEGPSTDARETRAPRAILGLASVAIVCGWFTVPVPWPQFLLPLLPLWALGAASALAWGADAVDRRTPPVLARVVLPLVCVAGAALWSVSAGRANYADRAPYAALLALTAAPLLLATGSARLRAAAVPLILTTPLAWIVGRIHWNDDELRASFEFVMTNTAPTDTVLTSWYGAALFRPHAYRYFFLHDGMLSVMTDAERGDDVLRILREAPPKAVERDEALGRLSPAVNAYLDEHYTPTGVGPIWIRRP